MTTLNDWLFRTGAQRCFPFLNDATCRLASPPDERYNCVGWAAGDSTRWWWPLSRPRFFWPSDAPLDETIECFILVFGRLGYDHRTDESSEPGRQKVAIFVDRGGKPTHAARQLQCGWWASKLGEDVDIEHELRAIEGPLYGRVALILGRVGTECRTQAPS